MQEHHEESLNNLQSFHSQNELSITQSYPELQSINTINSKYCFRSDSSSGTDTTHLDLETPQSKDNSFETGSNENKSVEEKQEETSSVVRNIATVFIIFLILLLAAIFWKKITRKIFFLIARVLEIVAKLKFPFNLLIFYCLLTVMQICSLPLVLLTLSVFSFYIKQFWPLFIIFLLSQLTAGFITFSLVKFIFPKFFNRRLEGLFLARMVIEEVDKKPWIGNLVVRFSMVPGGLKNWLLAFANKNLCKYLITLTVASSMYGSLYTFFGMSVQNITEIFKHKKFSERSGHEKFMLFFGGASCLITLILLFGFGFMANRKVSDFKKKIKRQEEKENKMKKNKKGFQMDLE